MLISMIHTLFTPDVPERSICFFVVFFYIKRLFIALKSETIFITLYFGEMFIMVK